MRSSRGSRPSPSSAVAPLPNEEPRRRDAHLERGGAVRRGEGSRAVARIDERREQLVLAAQDEDIEWRAVQERVDGARHLALGLEVRVAPGDAIERVAGMEAEQVGPGRPLEDARVDVELVARQLEAARSAVGEGHAGDEALAHDRLDLDHGGDLLARERAVAMHGDGERCTERGDRQERQRHEAACHREDRPASGRAHACHEEERARHGEQQRGDARLERHSRPPGAALRARPAGGLESSSELPASNLSDARTGWRVCSGSLSATFGARAPRWRGNRRLGAHPAVLPQDHWNVEGHTRARVRPLLRGRELQGRGRPRALDRLVEGTFVPSVVGFRAGSWPRIQLLDAAGLAPSAAGRASAP
jgi:hypothetical protein